MTDPAGAGINMDLYGVPWIPSRNTTFMLAYIPAPAGSVMGYTRTSKNLKVSWVQAGSR